MAMPRAIASIRARSIISDFPRESSIGSSHPNLACHCLH
jgi:hypothetical protein